MIKIQDLRIGNWYLNENGLSTQVDALFGVELMGKPIQLTEQWLLNFAFLKENAGYLNNEIYIAKIDSVFCHPIMLFDCEDYLEIQYIHQLQNLYHALTGEELTLTND